MSNKRTLRDAAIDAMAELRAEAAAKAAADAAEAARWQEILDEENLWFRMEMEEIGSWA